jgi:hypothetical protein
MHRESPIHEKEPALDSLNRESFCGWGSWGVKASFLLFRGFESQV